MKTIWLVSAVAASWLLLLFCGWALYPLNQEGKPQLLLAYSLGMITFTVISTNVLRFPDLEGFSWAVPTRRAAVRFLIVYDMIIAAFTAFLVAAH